MLAPAVSGMETGNFFKVAPPHYQQRVAGRFLWDVENPFALAPNDPENLFRSFL